MVTVPFLCILSEFCSYCFNLCTFCDVSLFHICYFNTNINGCQSVYIVLFTIYAWFYAYCLCQKWRNENVQSILMYDFHTMIKCHWTNLAYQTIVTTARLVVSLQWRAGTMASPNGHFFRVSASLWGESTGKWWIPIIMASDAELWYLF